MENLGKINVTQEVPMYILHVCMLTHQSETGWELSYLLHIPILFFLINPPNMVRGNKMAQGPPNPLGGARMKDA